ncbi:MAG: glycosyltransferase family 2 protein, partial [Waterburya sp.]
HKPLISIVVIIADITEAYLVEMLESVLMQIYPYWELYLADNASTKLYIREILEEYATKDIRIKLILKEQQENTAVIYNSALELATGDFVAILNQGDILTPNALYEIVELLNRHPEADMIYSDEGKVNEAGEYFAPHFKPNWCPDSFLSRMYTSQLGVYRYSIIQEIGGFRSGYDDASNYDLILRFTEKTAKVFHIPKILYHARVTSINARQAEDLKGSKRAIEDALNRRNENGEVIENKEVPGIYTVRYKITEYKLVSIIIPTKNCGKILHQCLKSIFEKSTYPHYEVIIIDNGTEEQNTLEILQYWQKNKPDRCFCHRLDIPFNYSKLNNFGVSKAQGDYLLFLNNDTEVITEDWIEGMVEQTQRKSIGAVGALLLYPDHKIQHGGVILGIRGVASHSHKNFFYGDTGYSNQLVTTNNYSAVTAACLMCRREVFEEVNGFDETLQVAFNDVDFCLKIKSQGYNNVCLPYVVLYHHESQSRGYDDTLEKQERFRQEVAEMEIRWEKLIAQDPCYNINLSKTREDYSLSGS